MLKKTWLVLKSIVLGLRVLFRPKTGIFALIEFGNAISDTKGARLAAEKIQQDPSAFDLIDQKYSLNLLNVENLSSNLVKYKENSLGYELCQHLKKLNSDGYPVPLESDYSNDIYIRERRREIHDLLHVVTGYGTSYKDEACLNAFIAAKGPMPVCILIPAGVIIRCVFLTPKDLDATCSAIANAWQRGKTANSVFGIKWEQYLDLPVKEAQDALFINNTTAIETL